MLANFPVDTRVQIKVGPTLVKHTGTVTDHAGAFLVVKCEDEKERKVRPGSAAKL